MKIKRLCIGYASAMLLIIGSTAAAGSVRQAVRQMTIGRWDAALKTLEADADPADQRVDGLKALVQAHLAQQQQRRRQRQAVFEEKRSAVYAFQWHADEEETLLEMMGLFKAAWDNADADQQAELLSGQVYAALRDTVQARFIAARQAGQWDTAWSRWLRWLVIFEPNNFQQARDALTGRRQAADALKKNPCDETRIPYANVNRRTVMSVFNMLDDRYVEPLPYATLAEQGLRRLALLPEVLGNLHSDAAFEVNDDGIAGWEDHLARLLHAEMPDQKQPFLDMLDILSAVNAETLQLPEGAVLGQFAEAAIAALDPYTEVVWPESVGMFEKNMTGRFGGVGIRIKKDGHYLIITSIIPDTPAAQTTLAPDDLIVAVDGRSMRDMSTDCAVEYIVGPVDTSVALSIRRPGAEKDELVTVKRQQIVLPTVEGAQRADNQQHQGHWDYFLDSADRIGYLQLNGFTDKTTEQARTVLQALEKQQIAGLIVDMRGNGGGLLTEATAFANLFVADGVLLTSRGRNNKEDVWQAQPNAVQRDYPIVILIDDGSASASEIVAGAVAARTDGQALLFGTRTYGKGTVQEVFNLGRNGGRIKMTTGYYFLPDGRPVQNRYQVAADGRTDWGIAPTLEIPLYAYERAEVRRLQLERRRQLTATADPEHNTRPTPSLVEQMLAADAQLAAAVVVIKARILAGY